MSKPQTFELRDYQRETIDDIYRLFGEGQRRVVGVMPTGGGKTVLGVTPVVDCVRGGRRVLWLAHRTELIDQAAGSLHADSSGMTIGVLQGRRRETHAQVIVASMLTAVQPGALSLLQQAGIGLIVIDECHHAVAPSYMTIVRELGGFGEQGPLVLGLTATLARSDGLALSDLWQAVAKPVEMDRLIREGWLLPPRGVRVKVDGFDPGAVGVKADASQAENDRVYGAALAANLAPAAVARTVLERCAGRKGVAFLPSVEMSKEQARVFCEHGLRAVHMDADTPPKVRKAIMTKVRAGEYDVLCNVGIATEGTDVPLWSYAVLARMTSSSVLFTQMVGRPLRPYPGQTDALILDVVGVTSRHRLRTHATLEGAPPVREIPDDLLDFDLLEDPLDDELREQQRDEPGGAVETDPGVDGALVHELVDLFSASDTAWQQSPRGVWFLAAGGRRAVFLSPGQQPGTYDVQWTTGELVHEDSLPLDAAMSWGERAATAAAVRPVERAASWRKRKATLADQWAALSAGGRPEQLGREFGGVQDVLDRRWAAEAIDALPVVAGVTPAGYWATY